MGSPSSIPKIKIDGDWHKVQAITNTLDKVLMIGALAGQEAAAKRMKKIARRYIRTNGAGLGWPPYSERYRKWKIGKGGSATNYYVLSGLYYRSINVWQKGLAFYVGLPAGIRHPDPDKPSLTFIARILESGSTTRNIKARPLWTPTFKELGGSAAIKGLMLWHIRDQIYKAYMIRAKVRIT